MRLKNQQSQQLGITLVEMVLVLALLSVFAAIIIVAINPSKQLADSRDATREADLLTITQAVYQYAADNDGEFPDTISSIETEICLTDTENCGALVDLSVLTDNSAYIVSLPVDPLCVEDSSNCGENGTGYMIMTTGGGSITVTASSSENRVITTTQ